ncbi:site-specific DNA-methyltransferase [Moorella sulfitireducens (nom. illeg.)]|uniref:site-specific DNA-methyltransferase n=1 Tax=Neomoorella sulfitireducens TaxID=2972948 RepID=UPI0021ABCFEA|nr:site-specific DNA-methyltransferase [Moorella sulfitireducens]
MPGFNLEDKTDWKWWVTPRGLYNKPVHRWFVFPHSFTSELVQALIDDWHLDQSDYILDPFVGAGTTVLAARERGVPARGYDIMPLAVMVTNVKSAGYDWQSLSRQWQILQERLRFPVTEKPLPSYPELVQKALPGKMLAAFDKIKGQIASLTCSREAKDFFRLALLALIPEYSQALATGGWLQWVHRDKDITSLPEAFAARVEAMLDDLHQSKMPRQDLWLADQADARQLPDAGDTYSAVITSPPYPNRHDYTRVYGIELMFDFLSYEDTRQIRYQSLHSHPEARPERPARNYEEPPQLTNIVTKLENISTDRRIPRMIRGYFWDIYLCLQEMKRVCRPGGRIALVVGNARYYGIAVPVDELTAILGEQAGLTCSKIIVVRYRGNSAQQMGKYGRQPSRESIVVFHKAAF